MAEAETSAGDLRSWVPDRPGIDHNVVVVGGGQNGCAFAFALSRSGIGKVSIIDAAPDADHAGVWLTRARMRRLRTPKAVSGPELGVRELSFQSWYEATRGAAAYDVFDRISRTDWADYLSWYRTTLGLPVRYGTRLVRIEPDGAFFRLHLVEGDRPVVETARKIILANGVAGSGGPSIPPVLSTLPRSHLAHTADAIDFDRLAGKSVAVVGAAASAFDAAAVALESGAANVHLFVRRDHISSLPVYRNRFYPGAFEHYSNLPDAVRWRQALLGRDAGSTPPAESIDRVTRHRNFHLHLSAPWSSAIVRNDRVEAGVNGETFAFDFVIAGTGYFTDLSARPELADIVQHIRLWRDQYVPPEGAAYEEGGAHPYLGLAHEFLEKTPGTAPYLRNIHAYNPGAYVSFGLPTGDIWTMRRDVPIITKRIGLDLFLDDVAHHDARMLAPLSPEFGIERYASAIWRGRQPILGEGNAEPADVQPRAETGSAVPAVAKSRSRS
ncbi:Predicted flavoprotein CzcO associated with the cation diffusion facilitator CzcD [Devosia enhydra]|uniref:Predicted flavoprotein CzcO associated with the cation diffusion facilitator CzcD n=1 Tax=Devosia enhydra TaxID=665118 RepID=A0A1K2HXS0_9HYPH|nr:NAD(P)-binding domain-containing protein [Devosia enhydra]SFZ84567.1 Predicted flavoprotein CzcO associated with the cation diffusion facilitator CzcD [Devosia enhydra]